jgi:hypothetical protein
MPPAVSLPIESNEDEIMTAVQRSREGFRDVEIADAL